MLKVMFTTMLLFSAMFASSAEAFTPDTAMGFTPAATDSVSPYGMKVPSTLVSRVAIPPAVKAFLDRDFRSRYPLAAPVRVDVLKAQIELYDTDLLRDGYGGFDTRHHFRVRAIHDNGAKVSIEVSLIERSDFEPDQDPILIESFRILGWAP